MTKTLVIPNHAEMIKETLSFCDGIILGIDGLSVNLPFYIQVDELEKYQNIDKKIFITLNKNFHNKDLPILEKTLKKMKKYPIDGVFYYDISIVNLKQKLDISYPLIWSQEHLVTNAETCNFWKTNGVSGAYLSNEITLEEIKEIRNNTDVQLFVTIFGYLPMFVSKRHLVKNYLKQFHLKEQGNHYKILKENKTYPIVDDKNGTTVYSSYILNAILEYLELKQQNIDYVILNSFGIKFPTFIQILQLLSTLTEQNKQEIFDEINKLCNQNTDKGFLYKETVYKVKGGS